MSGQRFAAGAYLDDDKGTNSGSVSLFEKNGDSWNHTTKILANDGVAGDGFGWSVHLSGDELLVGARLRDDKGTNSGAVYFFIFDGTLWNQTQKITTNDVSSDSEFGYSLSRKGNRAVIGAPYHNHGGTCIECGKAYVFSLEGILWIEEAILQDNDKQSNDFFGYSVSIDGDHVVVGVPFYDDKGADSGSVVVFEKIDNSWNQIIKLYSSDPATNEYFGSSVWIESDTIAVGSNQDDTFKGSVFMFKKTGSSWNEIQKIVADPRVDNQRFGWSVSMEGDNLVVGAPQSNNPGVYLFKRNGDSWNQTQKISPNGITNTRFGYSLSINQGFIAVGANQDNEKGTNSGAVWMIGE